ncbi:unnamed protein product [Candida parapsilosis]
MTGPLGDCFNIHYRQFFIVDELNTFPRFDFNETRVDENYHTDGGTNETLVEIETETETETMQLKLKSTSKSKLESKPPIETTIETATNAVIRAQSVVEGVHKNKTKARGIRSRLN